MFPAPKSRFLTYGVRALPSHPSGGSSDTNIDTSASSVPDDMVKITNSSNSHGFLNMLEATQVPHSYFKHFYVVSVLSSLFWLYQMAAEGSLIKYLYPSDRNKSASGSMSANQIILTWTLMLIHGVRRLIESTFLAKPSTSQMWILHWIIGMAFYVAMGMAVWVEGASQLVQDSTIISRITFSPPSLRTFLSLPVFILASGIQHDCHIYLASLPRYTLPVHPIFNTLVCPHYTAECLIYASLAILSAPVGAWINRTIFSVFCFTSVNLSITASSTKEGYEKRFGKERVAHRWTMFPGVW